MKLGPKKSKFRKSQRGPLPLKAVSTVSLIQKFAGTIRLSAFEPGIITGKQIESFKQTLNKVVKKVGRVTLYIFPHTPITKKPVEVRMGKGKGNVDQFVCKIKEGTVLCEIESSNTLLAINAIKKGQIKLPIKTRINQ